MIKYIIYWASYVSNYDTLAISGRMIVTDSTVVYYTREGYKTGKIVSKIDNEFDQMYLLEDKTLIYIGVKRVEYSVNREHITLKRK